MAPRFDQLPPASIEYCQPPWLGSTDWPRTATPAMSSPSAGSLKLPATSDNTVAPAGDSVSSATAASVALPVASGASLTAPTVNEMLSESVRPAPSRLITTSVSPPA